MTTPATQALYFAQKYFYSKNMAAQLQPSRCESLEEEEEEKGDDDDDDDDVSRQQFFTTEIGYIVYFYLI